MLHAHASRFGIMVAWKEYFERNSKCCENECLPTRSHFRILHRFPGAGSSSVARKAAIKCIPGISDASIVHSKGAQDASNAAFRCARALRDQSLTLDTSLSIIFSSIPLSASGGGDDDLLPLNDVVFVCSALTSRFPPGQRDITRSCSANSDSTFRYQTARLRCR